MLKNVSVKKCGRPRSDSIIVTHILFFAMVSFAMVSFAMVSSLAVFGPAKTAKRGENFDFQPKNSLSIYFTRFK